jgi:thiamine pyrophosphate-dependent acetolactate synthase large subunit-like protein
MSPSASDDTLPGASLAVRALEHAGVEVAFGLPGVHNLALWRALGESPIRLVGVRHEQTAAYAADGYARAGGRLGVALTTTGPGAANTLAAVGEAWACRQPLLVIATDIPSGARRPGVWRGALHEATDQAALFEPVVKQTFRVRAPEDVGVVIAEAARVAQDAPARPVYVEIPTDLLSRHVPPPAQSPSVRSTIPVELPNVERAAEALAQAERPLIWAGGGALQSGAGAAVAALAERLVAPVITTYSARGLLAPDHPCRVDAPPHVPNVGALWDEADVVLALGSDFDGMMTLGWKLPRPPLLVAVNVDPDDAGKNYPPDVMVKADVRAAAEELTDALQQRPGLDELAERLRELDRGVRAELAESDPEALAFLEVVERVLPAEATVVCDMCIPGYWLGGFLRVPGPRRLAYPLGWGTLGCGFPQGLGAALAGTGPVVSVSGDGGFLYAPGELATLKQEAIPLTAVIVDDGGYGMLRFDQDLHGDPHEGVDLVTPDFVALAQSFGVHAEQVDGLAEDFAAALERQLAMEEPTVLVARAALQPPPNVSPRWYRR